MDRRSHVFRSIDGAFPTVGVRGASAHTFVQQIFDVLENQLSREYRQLFAEPVVDDASKRIDWWSDLDGPVEPFPELPDDQKSAFRLEIEDRFEAIQDRAAALRRSGQDDAIFIAELLNAVVKTPSEANWFSVGGRPVITLWAHERTGPTTTSAHTFVKAEPLQDPGVHPEAQPERENRGFGARIWAWLLAIPAWARWLVLLLLLLILMSWLLRSCVPNSGPLSFSGPDLPNLGADAGGETSVPDAQPDAPQTDQTATNQTPTDPARVPPQIPSIDGTTSLKPPLVQPGVVTPGVVTPGVVTPGVVTQGVVIPGAPPAGTVQIPGVSVGGGAAGSGSGQAPTPAPQAQIVLQYEEARASEAQLRAEIAQLEAQIAARQQQCTPAICRPDGTPLPISPAPVAPAPLSPEPASPVPVSPKPQPEPKPEQPVKPQSETQQEPPTKETVQSRPGPLPTVKPKLQPVNCPAPRPVWEAPEIVLVFDTSGGMALPLNMSAQQRDALIKRVENGDVSALRELSRLSSGGGRKLIDGAKDGIGNMVAKMPKDVDIGYIEFGACKGVLNHSFYPNDRRGQLLDKVDAAQTQKGTPLARAIERAGNIIKGESANEKGTIVVVTDGYDSCGGDPCAAARAIAQSKPGVTINVVNLDLGRQVQCISQNGRGRTITADEASLRDAIIQASEEPPLSENCR